VGPRSLNVRPTYRRRRVWPWVAAAAGLLAVGGWELRARRPEGAGRPGASASPGEPPSPGVPASGTAPPLTPGVPVQGVGGVVLGPDGQPAAGVEVTVLPDGREERTDSQGQFVVPVADGATVELQAHHSDLGYARAELQAPALGVQLRLAPRATVVAKVLSGGRPVPGAAILVEELGAPGATFQADRTTDRTGTLRFAGLPGGPVRVEARAEGSAARASARVDVAEGSVVTVILNLPPVEPRGP